MFKKFNKSDSKGFTIVEVMFVLAIAALIMLIVFLAVPALQRSSRNTSRKTDAGRISSAVADIVSNSNGTLPDVSAANWNAGTNTCAALFNDAGTLGQFTSTNVPCAAGGAAPSAGNFVANTNYTTTIAAVAKDTLYLDEGVTCPATGGSSTITPVAGSSRQIALFYTAETGNGFVWNCLTVQ